MQLGAELARLRDIERVLRIRKQQLPQITLADRIFYCALAGGELRQIEGVAIEHHHRRIALVGLTALHGALLQDQESAGIVVDQFAGLRQYGDLLGWIAPVVEEDAEQLTI